MKPNEIAKVCKTATEAKKFYKEIAKDKGADKAREIIKKACELINARNAQIKADTDKAREWLRDYSNIMKSVFVEYVNSAEFKKANKGARFNGNYAEFIKTYFPMVTKSGFPVVVKIEAVDGQTFKRYRKMNLTRSAAFSVLDTCTKSIYKNRIGQFKQVIF